MPGLVKLDLPVDVWRWTWFSDEKGMEFNGYAARLPEGLFVIDPAYAEPAVWSELKRIDDPLRVLLTNKDHERDADTLRRSWKLPVQVHEDDAILLTHPPELTFKDGQVLGGALKVVQLTGMKSPGECALYWAEPRVLFVGDAVTGHPKGALGLVKKHEGKPEVLQGLHRLLELDFDALLVGDGEPILTGGKALLETFLAAAEL